MIRTQQQLTDRQMLEYANLWARSLDDDPRAIRDQMDWYSRNATPTQKHDAQEAGRLAYLRRVATE